MEINTALKRAGVDDETIAAFWKELEELKTQKDGK